jgi:hypothetical protein
MWRQRRFDAVGDRIGQVTDAICARGVGLGRDAGDR